MPPSPDGERQSIGLCGLGQMGLAVATRLATAYDVIAYDPDDDRRALARALSGVRPVEDIAALSSARVVVLSLPRPTISHQVCTELTMLLADSALVVETSTVLPRDVRACGDVLRAAGITVIDAAILSGVGQMTSGTATLLVGGADTDIAAAMPVLEVVAARIERFGDLGSGMAAKVVNNAVAHAVMVVLIEAFAMAQAHGLDVADIARMLEAPDGGLIRPLTHRIMERMAHGDYDGGMPLDAARKDSTLALAMAQEAGVPLFATQAAHTVYELGLRHGLGRGDYAAIASLWEEWCAYVARVRRAVISHEIDVVVVGGGNAGFTAAHAAASRGRRTVILEKGTQDTAGGNSYYTAGAIRLDHHGFDDLADLVEPDERHAATEVPPYPPDEYAADLATLTDGRNDPELTAVLVSEAQASVRWLHGLGLRYRLMYERQAYQRPDGTYLFFGGLHVGNVGGGEGLMADHLRVARHLGVDIHYSCSVTDLVVEGGRVVGVLAHDEHGSAQWRAESVILAAGGFEANPSWRKQHLGAGWEHAKVRGTPHNTGDLIDAALRIGAAKGGDWSSAHGVQWDACFAHNESNRALTNRLTRQSYPLGIIVNRHGERFVDEGADYRNYTYAKYGKAILEQPGSIAYQLFDARLRPLLRGEEYDMPGVSVERADTIEDLAARIGVDGSRLATTIHDFNRAIDPSIPFEPAVKDGRRADVIPPKSNWASPLDTPPYYAYPVTCGITFTFGGVKGDASARVLDDRGQPIPGLFACGEMLGGLFSGNYPGGTGLAAGTVFGRRAGSLA